MFSFYIPQGERPEDYREEVIRRLARMKEYAEEDVYKRQELYNCERV